MQHTVFSKPAPVAQITVGPHEGTRAHDSTRLQHGEGLDRSALAEVHPLAEYGGGVHAGYENGGLGSEKLHQPREGKRRVRHADQYRRNLLREVLGNEDRSGSGKTEPREVLGVSEKCHLVRGGLRNGGDAGNPEGRIPSKRQLAAHEGGQLL
jgi:hypothetical protein